MAAPNDQQDQLEQSAAVGIASDAHQTTPAGPDVESKPNNESSVRFSSAVEEIAPGSATSSPEQGDAPALDNVAADQLRDFTKSLHGRPLQERRMNTFQFEPFSLPASRVPSYEESSDTSRLATPTSANFQQTPHGSPRLSAMASPPLTPAGSDPTGGDRKSKDCGTAAPPVNDYQVITPQPSTSHEKPGATGHQQTLTHRSVSPDNRFQRSSSADDRPEARSSHRQSIMGSGAGSVPVSRESSPSRSAASNFYSKPMTPGGDANDPYAKGKRPPQQHATRHNIDPRFVFSRKSKPSPSASKTSLTDKRSSGLFSKGAGDDAASDNSTSTHHSHRHHHHNNNPATSSQGSMADLKRFFKGGRHQKKRDSSPASSIKATKLPAASRSTTQLPFGDDHGMSTKYGKIGKVLGSGAGGSVRLMKRKDDNTVFAVKEFRARHTYETEKDYNKKVTAEFCVGSTLHHGNIIETLDILHEKGRWYEIMEYAPFDLFAIVMTGKMGREEVTCCFLQILNGVTYLHSLGLAHRDLKLDNVVVSDKGIMKIIDFGSAHVFKYPFETDIVPAKGIVGSDPYLAPEVYDAKEYDAAAVDIWSLAIIYCCMTLRRFPWKLPRLTDNSFRLFASDPTPGHDPQNLITQSRRASEHAGRPTGEEESKADGHGRSQHGRSGSTVSHRTEGESQTSQSQNASQTTIPQSSSQGSGEKKEVIRGPWRILRLLPRESRHIMWRMLEVDPKKRATMDEVLQEPWVADTVICQQLDDGEVIPAEDHEHVLEPPNAQQQQPPQKA